jgi:hypothetical protein
MNKREQGHVYRVHAMMALAHLGYATTRQLARIVHRQCSASTRKMMTRTIRWLLEERLVVTKRDGDSVAGEMLVALTAKGAGWLAEHGEPLPGGKAHARDWLRHAHSHRTACNSVYAALCGLLPEPGGWSELEIRNGSAPITEYPYSLDSQATSKIPDVLMQLHDGGFVWLEVENSWRNDKDMQKLRAFLRSIFWVPGQVREVRFVITRPGAKTIGERLRRLLSHGPDSGWARQIRELDARILAQHVSVFSLDEDRLELSPVTFAPGQAGSLLYEH